MMRLNKNFDRSEYAPNRCLHHLFEAQAARTPEAAALIFDDQILTYRQLNERANRLAHALQARGVGPEVLVGLCAERSFELIVGLLAVLKAGGGYLPLDPNYPAERLKFMLADTQAPLILTQAHLVERLPEHTAQVLRLNEDFAAFPATNPASPVTLDNVAYVLYTSGSTGTPKGVLGLHRVAVNRVRHEPYPFEANEVLCQKTSLNFIDSIWEIFAPLTRGLATVLVPDQTLTDPPQFVELLARYGVTRLGFVASFLRFLLNSEIDLRRRLPRLKYWTSTGEPLSVELAGRFAAAYPEARLFNLYGTSEIWDATLHTFDKTVDQERVPIGQPLANVEIYILDRQFQPVPRGATGELFVGGEGLARGYHRRPELTAEKFVPHPFSDRPGARLYRTGDLARYRPDGNVEFMGRVDHQVKLRGFRIELGEIETVLQQHPQVQEAVVLVRTDGPDEKYLAAYVVPKVESGTSLAGSARELRRELRRFLQTKLPDYMVPAALVLLEKMPLTPSGKIYRLALPAPQFGATAEEAHLAPPLTPTEIKVAGLWAEVLGVDRVSLEDNFFELGGHSLLATRLISRIRDVFQVEVPIRTLFEIPTITGLAELLDLPQNAEPGRGPLPAMRPVSRTENLPLSFAQQRLWFLEQLQPDSPTYNLCSALRLTGPLNVTALERSLATIIRRHEALRTTFTVVDGQPLQVVRPPEEEFGRLAVVDLQTLVPAERQVEVQRLMTAEARRPFDLVQGPLLRLSLLRLTPNEHILLVVTHHIVSDGWSEEIFFHEMSLLYNALVAGRPAHLPDLPIQYPDYALWQRRYLQDEVMATQLSYWQQQLGSNRPLLQLPVDHARPPVQTFRGLTYRFHLPGLGRPLKVLAYRENVTLFMLLLAAFKVLLYRYTGQVDILIGTPVANRTRSEVEKLIGFFVNTLVLRTDLSGNPTFQTLLKRLRQVTLAAYTYQDLPFEQLVEALHPQRDLSRQPLFQVMFVLQETLLDQGALAGLRVEPLPVETETAKFDLTLFIEEQGDELLGWFEYNTDLFEPETIERLATHFQVLLESLVKQGPEQRLLDLPLLTGAERQKLLVEWNNTTAPYPNQTCFHRLFEAQVQRTPEAVAVICGEERLTYRALDQKANQLAHYLRDLGVGPEAPVGICLHRSTAMMIGLLGVLKAGGAYLPLDPAYPKERLAYMVQDAGVRVLVSQVALGEMFQPGVEHIVYLDRDQALLAQKPVSPPASEVVAENLAYIIYTSGSTGRPKGTMIHHRGLVNYLTWAVEAYRVAEGQGSPVHTSIGFDLTITSLFLPLLAGRVVEFLPEIQDIEALSLCLHRSTGWSAVKITPAHLEMLRHQLPPAEAAGRTQAFIIGGEALWGEALSFWRQHAPTTRLINEYGPTETVVGCCVYEVQPDDELPVAVPIGRPIANTTLYVLDQQLQPVPIGVSGELYIGGDGVARGYLNRPELTAEKFIPDPFSRQPGARLYRTGDLVRYRADGNLEFLGRIDQQVKIRGFRIEPGEIETVLERHPAVHETVVLAQKSEAGQDRLVAYIVPGRPVTAWRDLENKLGIYLKENLPNYMIPAALVLLEQLPLTINGKIDQEALPIPDLGRAGAETYVASRDAIELQLVQIWENLLKVHPIGVTDDFFNLGGHSLLAVRLMAQIQRQFGQALPLASLFQGATIENLARLLRRRRQTHLAPVLAPIQTAGWSGELFGQPDKLSLAEPQPRLPFFCIHSANGSVLSYGELARQLGPAQPFFGLQAIGLEDDRPPLERLEEMAAHYAAAIRQTQPTGPYLIGGWSMGGVVAFEIAQQLTRQGQEVALLVLIDSQVPVDPVSPAEKEDDTRLLAEFLKDLRSRFTAERPELATNFSQLDSEARLSYILEEARLLEHLFPEGDLSRLHRLFQVFKANLRALRQYRPQPYAGRIVLFRATEEESANGTAVTGPDWSRWAEQPVEIHHVPGDHYTMLIDPYVGRLAETLRRYFDQVATGQLAQV